MINKPTILFLGFSLLFLGCENYSDRLNLSVNASLAEVFESSLGTDLNSLFAGGEAEPKSINEKQDLEFTYEINRSGSDANSYSIDAELKNNGSTPFYFMSESCNGLDYSLEAEPKEAQIEILMQCFISMPLNIELAANSSHSFHSRLRTTGKCESVRLKLMLVELEEETSFEGKSISVIRASSNIVQLIGPLINLP